MPTEIFKASAQYNDWQGTIAADRSNLKSIEDWLISNNIELAGMFVLGINVSTGENPARYADPLQVEVLLVNSSAYADISKPIGDGSIEVERKHLNICLVDFFGLFKRFEMSLSRESVLAGREYQCIECALQISSDFIFNTSKTDKLD